MTINSICIMGQPNSFDPRDCNSAQAQVPNLAQPCLHQVQYTGIVIFSWVPNQYQQLLRMLDPSLQLYSLSLMYLSFLTYSKSIFICRVFSSQCRCYTSSLALLCLSLLHQSPTLWLTSCYSFYKLATFLCHVFGHLAMMYFISVPQQLFPMVFTYFSWSSTPISIRIDTPNLSLCSLPSVASWEHDLHTPGPVDQDCSTLAYQELGPQQYPWVVIQPID